MYEHSQSYYWCFGRKLASLIKRGELTPVSGQQPLRKSLAGEFGSRTYACIKYVYGAVVVECGGGVFSILLGVCGGLADA